MDEWVNEMLLHHQCHRFFINNTAHCGSTCCQQGHKHRAKWRLRNMFAESHMEEKNNNDQKALQFSAVVLTMSFLANDCDGLTRCVWTCRGWAALRYATLALPPARVKEEEAVLILQVCVTVWFVGDSVAAVGFILHACFRKATEFRLMESFPSERKKRNPSILSYFWQFGSIANVWKSPKSSQILFLSFFFLSFFYPVFWFKALTPFKIQKKKSWKEPQAKLTAK